MKFAKILCLVLIMLPVNSMSQIDSLYAQQIHEKFEFCISQYISSSVNDSLNYLFYGNKVMPVLRIVKKYDGAFYEPKIYDIADTNSGTFYKELDYSTFWTFILSAEKKTNCIFQNLQVGNWIYINYPTEFWLQLSLDKVMQNEFSILAPTIDIISVQSNGVSYERKIVIMKFDFVTSSFSIEQIINTINYNVCK